MNALTAALSPTPATSGATDLVRNTANQPSDPEGPRVRKAGGWAGRSDGASDEALIRSLYEGHGRSLLAYATRLTGDRAFAEDVVQETLIRAWRHSESMINQKGSVRGWLLTVARNIVIDRSRAKGSRPTEVAESTANLPVEADHSESVVNSMVVLSALDHLSPEHREVLVELYYRGRTVVEAARVLRVPPGTVKSRSHYALRAMRTVISGRGTGGTR